MGYRSQVRIIVSKEGYNELKEVVAKEALQFATPDYDFNLLNHTDKISRSADGDQVMLSWDWIKWYDGYYKDVDAIIHGLAHLKEKGFSYRFSRIGEDYSDIEESWVDGELDQDLEYIMIERYFDDDYLNFKEEGEDK